MVLFPQRLQISRSLHKQLRNHAYSIRFDSAFAEVMAACAAPRPQHSGTWINPQMRQAYHQLHQCGVAHSFEAWEGDELIAGLYGVAIGQVFFGESMFHRRSNASKIVFAHLVQQLQSWGYGLIDCQVSSTHLQSLGAEEISREHFLSLLLTGCKTPPHSQAWQA